MKRFLLSFFVIAFLSFSSIQAQYKYVEDFVEIRSPHGVVVKKKKKIWVQPYAKVDTLSNGVVVSGLHVFDPDGTELHVYATGMIDGLPDTLTSTGRGLALDHNGNILCSNGYLYRINAQTGEFMNRYNFNDEGPTSLTQAAADANGYVYISKVVPGGSPLIILDENFDLYNFAVDALDPLSRALVVSPDGKDIYRGTLSDASGIIHYHSEDGPDATYEVVDSLLGPNGSGFNIHSVNVDPAGWVWAGSHWGAAPPYFGWYKIKTNILTGESVNGELLDSLGYQLKPVLGDPAGAVAPDSGFWSPRGVAFHEENDGSWTVYTSDFDGHVIKKWTNANPVGIIEVDNGVAIIKDFELEQNYPNPFNPTTKIPFALKKAAHVKLLVYNVSGQLVKTLVNETMLPGTYEYDFDARGLASGTYFYRISFDGKLQTRKMMFTK